MSHVTCTVQDGVAHVRLDPPDCWAWRRIPVPVIAAVHGHCLGGGPREAAFTKTTPEFGPRGR